MQRSRPALVRFLPCLALLAVCVGRADALAYIGNEFTYRQPDGTPFVIRLFGDDRSVRVETPEGWTLARDANRWWCYARPDADGIAPSALHVGAGDPATLGVAKRLKPSPSQRDAMRKRSEARLGPDTRGRPLAGIRAKAQLNGIMPAPPGSPTTGVKHGLTIMVKFSDHLGAADPDRPIITRTQVDNFCNGGSGAYPAYTEFENACSVYQYYYDNSHGLLQYTNHVVDYIQATRPRSYYADPLYDRAAELVTDVLGKVPLADLQAADADGDKVLDAVNIFYAGDCPNQWSEGLWPHMNPSFTWSGSGYSAGPYQMSDMKSHLAIGTFCHENGHMLCGFPDLYDYDYDSSGSAGFFSLMAAGNYGGTYQGTADAGTNPVMIDGYLATAAGWRTVTDFTAATTATVATAVAGSTTIFRYRNPSASSEYFLFENRERTGHDTFMRGRGLLIWHVDELGDNNDQRFDKNALHHNYELALVQADNRHDFELTATADYYGDATDPWYLGNAAPLYSGRFWDDSGASSTQNNARWWNGSASGLKVERISTPGPSMTFTIGSGIISPSSTALSVSEGNAGTTYATLQVSRTGTFPVSVQWATADGSATASGLDYLPASGTLVWDLGDVSTKTISIPILGDTTPEPDETFGINFTNPVGATLSATTTTVTIVNDDTAPAAGSLQVAAYSSSVVEGAAGTSTPVTVTVRRVGGSSGPVTVHWSAVSGTATAGSDFATAGGILSWADGDSSDQTVTVQVNGDALPEPDEAFSVALSAPTGGAIAPTPNAEQVTILNDDARLGFPASKQIAPEPTSGTATVYVVVHRDGTPHGSVAVDFATLPGTATSPTDFQAVSGTLVFPDGHSDATIPVTIAANTIPGDRRAFTVTLSNPQPAANALLGATAVITVEITDQALLASGVSSGTATNGALSGMCGAGAVGVLLGTACLGLGLRRRR